MDIGRPISLELRIVRLEAHAAHITRQCVEPDIENVGRIVRQWDAPLQCRAADREILQAATHERCNLVPAAFRSNELGILFIKVEEPVLKSRELEEVTLFLE